MSNNIASWMHDVIEHQANKEIVSYLKEDELGTSRGVTADGRYYEMKVLQGEKDIDLEINAAGKTYRDSLKSFGESYSTYAKNEQYMELMQKLQKDFTQNPQHFNRLELTKVIAELRNNFDKSKKISKADLKSIMVQMTNKDKKTLLSWLTNEGIKINDQSESEREAKAIKSSLRQMAEYNLFYDPELDRYEKAVVLGTFMDRARNVIGDIKDKQVKRALRQICEDDLLLLECLKEA